MQGTGFFKCAVLCVSNGMVTLLAQVTILYSGS